MQSDVCGNWYTKSNKTKDNRSYKIYISSLVTENRKRFKKPVWVIVFKVLTSPFPLSLSYFSSFFIHTK